MFRKFHTCLTVSQKPSSIQVLFLSNNLCVFQQLPHCTYTEESCANIVINTRIWAWLLCVLAHTWNFILIPVINVIMLSPCLVQEPMMNAVENQLGSPTANGSSAARNTSTGENANSATPNTAPLPNPWAPQGAFTLLSLTKHESNTHTFLSSILRGVCLSWGRLLSSEIYVTYLAQVLPLSWCSDKAWLPNVCPALHQHSLLVSMKWWLSMCCVAFWEATLYLYSGTISACQVHCKSQMPHTSVSSLEFQHVTAFPLLFTTTLYTTLFTWHRQWWLQGPNPCWLITSPAGSAMLHLLRLAEHTIHTDS